MSCVQGVSGGMAKCADEQSEFSEKTFLFFDKKLHFNFSEVEADPLHNKPQCSAPRGAFGTHSVIT